MRKASPAPSRLTLDGVAWIVCTAIAAAYGVGALMYGSSERAELADRLGVAVIAEHRAVCDKLARGQHPPNIPACMAELGNLKHWHDGMLVHQVAAWE
jgi:hypothetical protein